MPSPLQFSRSWYHIVYFPLKRRKICKWGSQRNAENFRHMQFVTVMCPLCSWVCNLPRMSCLADVSASVVQLDSTVRSTNIAHMSLRLAVIHSREMHVPGMFYIFRTTSCSSSGESFVSIKRVVPFRPAHKTVTGTEWHTRCCTDTINSPDDEHEVARNM